VYGIREGSEAVIDVPTGIPGGKIGRLSIITSRSKVQESFGVAIFLSHFIQDSTSRAEAVVEKPPSCEQASLKV
jgi:hypothetical protein